MCAATLAEARKLLPKGVQGCSVQAYMYPQRHGYPYFTQPPFQDLASFRNQPLEILRADGVRTSFLGAPSGNKIARLPSVGTSRNIIQHMGKYAKRPWK